MSYWFRNDNRLPQARLAIASYVIVGMVGVLLLGFWKLQVIDSDKYASLAERNRVREIPVIAPRGRMLDRDGRVLVDNRPSFSVLLLRDEPVLVEKYLPAISEGLGISLDDLKDQLSNTKNLPKFQSIIIKPEASPADIAYIESHKSDIPVLEMISVSRRRYLPDGFLSHAAGYVGEVSEQQIEASNGRLRMGDFAGKFGLERQYNDILMGTDGKRRVIVNSIGKEVGPLPTQEAIPGKQIQLSIDLDMQQVAEQSLGARPGAVVALDPRSGEVLAMASHPAIDPNDFAIRISAEEWKKLNDDPERPLLNRAIQAQLAPGSVFKIVMATAMYETKAVPESFSVFCPGYGTFYGRQFKCWVFGKSSHGVVDVHRAVNQSCDVFFYNLGVRLGIDRISYYATKFGLGRKTGIDLPSEEPGLMPSEDWVQRVFHRKWYPGETVSVAVGQGAVITTPLQLARLIGGIASGGVFMQPHMLKDAPNVNEDKFPLSESTIEKITDDMYGVVNSGGTGAALKLQGIEFSGKSGTAQVIGYATRDRFGKQKKFLDNAWFVGYAPRRNPEIVVSVLVQESGKHGGEAAGPVVRDIIKAYYDKKNKKTQGQFTADAKRPEPQRPRVPAAMAASRVALKTEETADTTPANPDREPER
ncbi:MAG: penicillin-binding protein 2 [Acidobacteria bacterium]|nr:MAG: penicillin-binding protein 2 [Acidobacteria bacterium 13_1_40CM_4_58_4]PYT59775.1 MAG: penicillin-binding protein 2 [Acidobacteriota bacterium]